MWVRVCVGRGQICVYNVFRFHMQYYIHMWVCVCNLRIYLLKLTVDNTSGVKHSHNWQLSPFLTELWWYASSAGEFSPIQRDERERKNDGDDERKQFPPKSYSLTHTQIHTLVLHVRTAACIACIYYSTLAFINDFVHIWWWVLKWVLIYIYMYYIIISKYPYTLYGFWWTCSLLSFFLAFLWKTRTHNFICGVWVFDFAAIAQIGYLLNKIL